MLIRKTTRNDLDRIQEIYSLARDFMVSKGNPNQWAKNNWPPLDLILNDIDSDKSYVCLIDNRIVGTFFFDFGKDIEPTYKEIYDGEWISDSPYGVIHRIATIPEERGVGSFIIDWCYKESKHLRIDTHKDNKVMKNLLNKLGFRYCGIIYVKQDAAPRLAFEKV